MTLRGGGTVLKQSVQYLAIMRDQAAVHEMDELGVDLGDDWNPPTQRGQQLLQTERRQGGAPTETQHREHSPGSAGKRG
jgi:hypothetical protein